MAKVKKANDSDCIKKKDIKKIKEELRTELYKDRWDFFVTLIGVVLMLTGVYIVWMALGVERITTYGMQFFFEVIGFILCELGTLGLGYYLICREEF